MNFHEENKKILERIKQSPDLIQKLFQQNRELRRDDFVGGNPSLNNWKRSFFTIRANIDGIPLGIKTGNPNIFPAEYALFEFLYDTYPSLRTVLPRVIGIVYEQALQKAVVIEDFSEGLRYTIEESDFIHPELQNLLEQENEDELLRTTFKIQTEQGIRYPIGDLNTLYSFLPRAIREGLSGRIIQITHALEDLLIMEK